MHNSANKRTSACAQLNEEAIQVWLVEQVTKTSGVRPDQVNISQPFSAYGINSLAAAALSAELANWLGEPVAPRTHRCLVGHDRDDYGRDTGHAPRPDPPQGAAVEHILLGQNSSQPPPAFSASKVPADWS